MLTKVELPSHPPLLRYWSETVVRGVYSTIQQQGGVFCRYMGAFSSFWERISGTRRRLISFKFLGSITNHIDPGDWCSDSHLSSEYHNSLMECSFSSGELGKSKNPSILVWPSPMALVQTLNQNLQHPQSYQVPLIPRHLLLVVLRLQAFYLFMPLAFPWAFYLNDKIHNIGILTPSLTYIRLSDKFKHTEIAADHDRL